MHRTTCFLAYHVLFAALATSLGCASFQSASDTAVAALPWPMKADAANEQGAPLTLGIAKGINHERAGEYDKAREVYEKLLRENGDLPEPLHRLAVVADKERRHDQAQALYTRAIQLEPLNAEYFNDLGYSFYLSGDLAKAESALAKAVQIEPHTTRFRNNLGMVIGHQGRYQEAFEQFAATGSDADAHYNLAFIYASQEKVEEAKGCFLRALASDPTHEKAAKALESFNRYEQNGGLPVDEDFTADGRRLILYIENPSTGEPDFAAMANLGINRPIDSVLPAGAHNIPQNREAGSATRSLHTSARVEQSMSSMRD